MTTIARLPRGAPSSRGLVPVRVAVGGEVTLAVARGVGVGVGPGGIETENATASRKLPTDGLPEPVLTARNAKRVQVWPAGTRKVAVWVPQAETSSLKGGER